MWQQLLDQLLSGNIKALARSISFVENGRSGYEDFMAALPHKQGKIVGVTGPPGAGKSTLVDALVGEIIRKGGRAAVLCIDPSSPFHLGALLGDRIRMSQWYLHPQVYIRSLATRGSMGGLHPRIIEITDLVNAAGFDYIIVETVGVGQSEIEIVGLADTTVVVVVPEAGDEVQTMKAGMMEIADIFVVNKSDRPGADAFVKNLRQMLAPAFSTHKKEIPVIKTVAHEQKGIEELFAAIEKDLEEDKAGEKKSWLLAERLYYLLQKERMRDVSKTVIREKIKEELINGPVNLYRLLETFR